MREPCGIYVPLPAEVMQASGGACLEEFTGQQQQRELIDWGRAGRGGGGHCAQRGNKEYRVGPRRGQEWGSGTHSEESGSHCKSLSRVAA